MGETVRGEWSTSCCESTGRPSFLKTAILEWHFPAYEWNIIKVQALCFFYFIPTCIGASKTSKYLIFVCLFSGPKPEDQPLLHPDQQHGLSTCRQPLLHPPHSHARPGWEQGLRLRLRHQPHLHTGEQRQRDYRWDLDPPTTHDVLKWRSVAPKGVEFIQNVVMVELRIFMNG